jgi:uncharacterized membrane protein YgdD (TMEM256/DUF423 family)
MTPRVCVLLAALLLALAVAAGAFGAHALRSRLSSDALAIYQTAVQYHFWHALGLLAIGVLWTVQPDRALLAWSAALLVAGIAIFSGSLYALALTGVRIFGAITPIGGVAFIAGWLVLAYSMTRG